MRVSVSVNLVSFTYGVYTGWPTMVKEQLESAESPVGNLMGTGSYSWVCSLGMPSAILGTFFWGLVADRYGRKVTGYLTMAPFLVSWMLLLTVKTLPALLVARLLGGLGASGAAINCPLYSGEVSDANMKAGLGSLFMLMYNVGVLYVYAFGAFVDYDYLNAAGLAVSVLFIVAWYFMVESPTYLLQKNDPEAAAAALRWLRGVDDDGGGQKQGGKKDAVGDAGAGDVAADAAAEFGRLRERIERERAERERTSGETPVYFKRSTVRALIIGLVFQTGTQMSGINLILMDTKQVLDNSGSTVRPDVSCIVVGAVQLLASVVALFVVNRAGRKCWMIGTYMVTAASLFAVGLCSWLHEAGTFDGALYGAVPVASLSLHVAAFSLGVGMVPYIIYVEILQEDVRNVCMAVLMFWNNALGFGVVKAYPLMTGALGPSGSFWLFAAVCLAVVPFTYQYVPETRNKDPEAIEMELHA